MPNIERRRAPRAAVSVPIQLSPQGEAQPATLKDLSTSGLACRFGEPVSEMTIVALNLELPGVPNPVHVQGAAIRCDKVRGISPPTYEIGIFFTDMSNEDRAEIAAFVEAQLIAIEG